MAADDTLIGKKLGDYTIQSLLGRGGMSRVYRGYDENLDRLAAIKVISGDFVTTTEEEYTRRFQSEARAVARLRHPNIVGIYQFGRSEGIYYMAQVFLEGKDLRGLLKDYGERYQRMPPEEILQIAHDVANALDYAHEQGVIHRDIKPSNIMLEKKTGRAILMDFGLALSVQEGTSGDTFGSAHYIAPEQAISSAKSVAQSDLYSLGIVLYEMIAGRVPFDDPSVMSVALKHLNEIPPPPSMYNPDLSPAVEQVIMRVLEKDPHRRYSTGQELVQALEQAFQPGKTFIPPGTRLPLVEMTDSWPKAPVPDATPAFMPGQRPVIPPPTAAVSPPPQRSPLADKFTRRKAEKEAQEFGSGPLELDEKALDFLLDSFPDPADIGLVGEHATGITRPDRPSGLSSSIASAQAAKKTKKRKRSRIGLLLPLILVVVIIGGGWWLGVQNGGDNTPEAPVVAAAEQTQTAVIALGAGAGETLTAAATFATVENLLTQPSTLTRTAVASATRNATRPPTTQAPAVIADGTEESSPEATDTEAPSDTPEASPTGEPSETSTSEPSETPSLAPTDTPSPEPAVTASEEPSLTPEPTQESGVVVSSGSEPDVRLIYDRGQFVLINLSAEPLDISEWVFEQPQPLGAPRLYRADNWQTQRPLDPPNRMRSGGCYQLVTGEASQVDPGVEICPEFLGYFQTTVTSRYFWISTRSDAVFTVRNTTNTLLFATCEVTAGLCEFNTNDATAITPTPIPVTPTPVPTTEAPGELRLIYDSNAFMVVNVSGDTQDISGLIFEQILANGETRSFSTALWVRGDIDIPPSQMSAGGCYQVVRAEGTQTNPDNNLCYPFLGWFRTGVETRYFWVSTRDGAVFTVRLGAGTPPLATCEIDAGECYIKLPE
ncbi:MAG: protein kinase [Chloroflexi bacterium]|nr:protein kinase [Chloroflexota bacterium]